ncbi:MAG: hypothetical protein NVV74_11940 [Magnetospirillum sp.]|nr:hypothetical protein [Magnetospirillum sp.]
MAPDYVSATFNECDAGWLSFSVEAVGQSVTLSASHIIDPFPAMIDWLHLVVGGATFCHWGVNEENWATSFRLARRADGLARLVVAGFQHDIFQPVPAIPAQANECDKLHMDVLVDPMQVAEAFFTAFDAFVHGPNYHPLAWECVTLGRMVKRVLPTASIDDLTALPPAELALLANALSYPGDEVWRTEAGSLAEFLAHERTRRTIPWAADGVFPTDLVDNVEGDVEVPADFASRSVRKRRAFVSEFLKGFVNNWDGDDLTALLAGEAASAIRHRLAQL